MRHVPNACLLVSLLLTACSAPATDAGSAHAAGPAADTARSGAASVGSAQAGAAAAADARGPAAARADFSEKPETIIVAGRVPAADVEAYRPAVTALIREALVNGQAYTKLVSLCATAPHRLSGSPGAAAAVEWVRNTLVADGMENVTLDPCMVRHWVRGDVAELVVVAPPELAGESFPILALGGSVATEEPGLSAEVVEVTSWEQLDRLGGAVDGKIVFFNRPMDASLLSTGAAYGGAVDQRGRGASAAARLGGVGAIVRSMTTRLDDFPHTGAMGYAEGVPKVPTAAVSTLGAERLSLMLRSGAKVSVRLRLNCETLPDAPSANVLGEIVGSELPDEVVVIGGHLDCWDVGQGAHDDGGGVCQSLEALRLIKATGMKPRRTIRAVAFMNEENGGRGAEAYYEHHLPAMDKHVLAIETDGGSFTPRGFSASAQGESFERLADIAALLSETGITWLRPGSGGADVDPMRASGVTVMGYSCDGQRYFDLHHSNRDTIDAVSPREINLSAACLAAMAYVVADMEAPLPRTPPPAPATDD